MLIQFSKKKLLGKTIKTSIVID